MYSREYEDQTYTFEPSGGLLNASLVMRDKETDSWWSIITDEAIAGDEKGKHLRQLPGSVKTTWGDWRERHPDAVVLSVDGVEHREKNPYDKYFESDEGFRRMAAKDDRLPTKADVYAFHLDGMPWAIPHELFDDGGAVVEAGDRRLFVYREKDDSMYRGTTALYLGPTHAVEPKDGTWVLHAKDGESHALDEETRTFGAGLDRAGGFDTFWYIWSLSNEGTGLVEEVVEK